MKRQRARAMCALVVLAVALGTWQPATANPKFSTCAQAGWTGTHADTWWTEDEFGADAKVIYYYIESDFASELNSCSSAPDLNQTEIQSVIQTAAETWNLSSRGMALVYGGIVPTDSPATACSLWMPRRPAVFVNFNKGCKPGSPCVGGAVATVDSIDDTSCTDAVHLTIWGDADTLGACTAPNIRNWAVDPGSASGADLPALLVHEFGHVLNLGHHTTSDSVMQSSGVWSNGVRKHRLVYSYDKDCVDEVQLGRSHNQHLQYYYEAQSASGIWQGVSRYSYDTSIDDTERGFFSGGVWFSGSTPVYPLYLDDIVAYSTINTDGTLSFPSYQTWDFGGQRPSTVTTSGVETSPTLFSSPELGSAYNARLAVLVEAYSTDLPYVSIYSSSNLFDTSSASYLTRCQSSTSCAATFVRTALPIAVTHDNYRDETIVAWVDTSRTGSGHTSAADDISGEVWIHPGFESGFPNRLSAGAKVPNGSGDLPTAPPDFTYDGKTFLPVGLACSDEEYWNCMVAWVDRGTPDGQILYRHFYVKSDGTISWFPGGAFRTPVSVKSVSGVSAAWVRGKWRLSWKSATGDPNDVGSTYAQSYTGGSNPYSWDENDWSSPRYQSRLAVVDAPTWLYLPGYEFAYVWTESE